MAGIKNSNISKKIENLITEMNQILQDKDNFASNKNLKKLKYLKKKISFDISYLFKNMKKNTLNNFSNMSDEIINLLEVINNKNCSYKLIKKKIKYLFKGYNGLGTSYYIFKKH